jgi:D-alanyl-D-alanine carboxypeptidase/D-alanyl-D-alanine-endopeptidase (penicillin-binding protein 4)
VKSRPFRLSYSYALLATLLIVGGAPPASTGLTGCAPPPARMPVLATSAPLAGLALAPSASASPSALLATAPPASAASAVSSPPSAPSIASASELAAAPSVPASPAHRWKGGEFQHPVAQLAHWAKKNGGELAAELADVASGAVLASVAANVPENPASNQKVLTTAAVLRHFGADFRFKTSLCGTRSADSVAALVLRGSGDPSLSSDDVQALAKTLAQAGVRRVGDILLDQSFFDAAFVPPAFEQQPEEWAAFRAPVSAVSLNRNVTTLNVAPGALGSPARVWFDPEGFVDVTGSVRTEEMARAEDVKLTLKESGMRLSALVAGSIQPGSAAFHSSRRVEDPSLLAGYGLRAALVAEGVQVSGKIALGGETEASELAVHESQALSELLPELGKDSDNFYAETLLKDLGARIKGLPGTSANGAAVVLDYLREIDALDSGTRISNGSGLFDANRISTRTLVKTLERAYQDPKLSRVFVAQLAVGGVDGTLKHRFSAFKKQRSIHAKTGTLDHVIALSGYAFRPDGSSPVAFSLIVSGISGKHAEIRKRVDDIVSSVARMLARDAG